MYAILAPGTGPRRRPKNRSISLIVSGKYHHGRILQDDFHHKLGGGRPPARNGGIWTGIDPRRGLEVSRIIHRQSKSAILDPEAFQSVTRKTGSVNRWPASPLLQLPPSRCCNSHSSWREKNNLFRGCEKALERLLDETDCRSAGILKLETSIVVQPNEKCLPRCSDRGKRIIPFPTRSRPAFFAKETPC